MVHVGETLDVPVRRLKSNNKQQRPVGRPSQRQQKQQQKEVIQQQQEQQQQLQHQKPEQRKSYNVIVASSTMEAQVDAEGIKKSLQRVIDLATEGIKIKNLKKMKDGRVFTENDSKEGIDKLLKNEAIKGVGLTASVPKGRPPRFILHDVPKKLADDQLEHEILSENAEAFPDDVAPEVIAKDLHLNLRPDQGTRRP